MNKKELNQLEIIKQVEAKKLSQKHGAEILAISVRQLRRKQRKYKKYGINGLKHLSKDRPSNNKTSSKTIKKILKLANNKYKEYGPTLMSEKLYENDKIKIDHETLRRILIKHKIWITKIKKKKKVYVWRERKHCEGEMIQADGSLHQWLTEEYITLLSIIDDATGKIYIKFASESTIEFSKFFREFIEQKGIPQIFYCDRGKVFKVNKYKIDKDAKTQFERILKELNVEIKHAYSPQAKGRVERLFRTLQDRLLKELKEKKIKTIEEANKYIESSKFIEKFNNKFSVKAKSNALVYQPINNFDLNSIFCKKYYRKINNDYTIQFKGNWYQLLKNQPIKLQRGSKVEVRIEFDNSIGFFKSNLKLNIKPIEKNKEEPVKEKTLFEELYNPRYIYRPPKNHPWRQGIKSKKIEDISTESKRGHF